MSTVKAEPNKLKEFDLLLQVVFCFLVLRFKVDPLTLKIFWNSYNFSRFSSSSFKQAPTTLGLNNSFCFERLLYINIDKVVHSFINLNQSGANLFTYVSGLN